MKSISIGRWGKGVDDFLSLEFDVESICGDFEDQFTDAIRQKKDFYTLREEWVRDEIDRKNKNISISFAEKIIEECKFNKPAVSYTLDKNVKVSINRHSVRFYLSENCAAKSISSELSVKIRAFLSGYSKNIFEQ